MEGSPYWKVNSFSASQGISFTLCKPSVYCRFHWARSVRAKYMVYFMLNRVLCFEGLVGLCIAICRQFRYVTCLIYPRDPRCLRIVDGFPCKASCIPFCDCYVSTAGGPALVGIWLPAPSLSVSLDPASVLQVTLQWRNGFYARPRENSPILSVLSKTIYSSFLTRGVLLLGEQFPTFRRCRCLLLQNQTAWDPLRSLMSDWLALKREKSRLFEMSGATCPSTRRHKTSAWTSNPTAIQFTFVKRVKLEGKWNDGMFKGDIVNWNVLRGFSVYTW